MNAQMANNVIAEARSRVVATSPEKVDEIRAIIVDALDKCIEYGRHLYANEFSKHSIMLADDEFLADPIHVQTSAILSRCASACAHFASNAVIEMLGGWLNEYPRHSSLARVPAGSSLAPSIDNNAIAEDFVQKVIS